MKILLLTMMIMQGCGSEPKTENKRVSDTAVASSAADDDEDWEEVEMMMVDALSDAPECNVKRKGQLVYSKDTAMFYSCNGKDYDMVDLRGEKGAKGDKGDTGATGATGAAGATGATGAAGAPLPNNEWYDAVSGNYWLIGGVNGNRGAYLASCSGSYRVATRNETGLAVNHGLWTHAQTQTSEPRAWTSDDTAYVWNIQTNSLVNIVGGTNYLILCIKI